MSQHKMPAAVKSATELGPILLFFAIYYLVDIYAATGAIMVTTVIALAIAYYYERRLPMMPLVTAIVVTIFGGLTLYLHDDTFIKMKPTIIYALFSAAMLAGLLMGRSFIKVMFGSFWELDEKGWKILTVRLVLFFGSLAIANEFIWRNFSEEFWVNAKVFGFTGITFVFFLTQVPLLNRHAKEEQTDES